MIIQLSKLNNDYLCANNQQKKIHKYIIKIIIHYFLYYQT